MKIILSNISKRFNYEWIFRDINYTFESGNAYALTGPNGSGKSTLLKVISGQLSPSQGALVYDNGSNIPVEEIYAQVTFTAPYIDLIEEFTLNEILEFHFSFKKVFPGYTVSDVLAVSGLEKHSNKPIKSFSSGMKQRVKIITTLLSDNSIVILDEPTTNLDTVGVDWYLDLVEKTKQNRIIITGSNMEREYRFCNHIINIADYKINI